MPEMYSGSYNRLEKILYELREKCPWDQKQTLQSLRNLTVEETYELADAIDNEDWQGVKEELGDILLHLMFYARIAEEQKRFDMKDVISTVCNKLVHRHPHIYATIEVANEEDVKRNWESLKLKEGKKSVLGGVPVSLPAMIKAYRLQEKAKQVGFEWENDKQVLAKIDEEWEEFREAKKAGQQKEMEEEFGDVLFSMVNYARFMGIDPEAALEKTNRKFKSRFEKMESVVRMHTKDLSKLSLREMDAIWNDIKKNEHNPT